MTAAQAALNAQAHQAIEDRGLVETRFLLTQWGLWVIDGRSLPDGPHSLLGVRKSPPSSALTDDEALRVDGAMAQLGLRRPQVRLAVELYYTNQRMTHTKLGRLMRVGKGTAQSLLSAGEHWLDAYLHV